MAAEAAAAAAAEPALPVVPAAPVGRSRFVLDTTLAAEVETGRDDILLVAAAPLPPDEGDAPSEGERHVVGLIQHHTACYVLVDGAVQACTSAENASIPGSFYNHYAANDYTFLWLVAQATRPLACAATSASPISAASGARPA